MLSLVLVHMFGLKLTHVGRDMSQYTAKLSCLDVYNLNNYQTR